MIYGLYSTRDNVIRYIGRTSNLEMRLSVHRCKPTNSGMKCFFDGFGDTIKAKHLEGFDSEDEAIRYYNEHFPGTLLNIQPGSKVKEPVYHPKPRRTVTGRPRLLDKPMNQCDRNKRYLIKKDLIARGIDLVKAEEISLDAVVNRLTPKQVLRSLRLL